MRRRLQLRLSWAPLLPTSRAALLPVPRAVTPAGLVAVRSLGPPSSLGSSAPFALLAAAVSGGVVQLTVHSVSDFGVPAPLSSPWVAASASANRSLLLLLRSSGAPVFLALLHEWVLIG